MPSILNRRVRSRLYFSTDDVQSATVTQFQGRVSRAEWENGILSLTLQDEMKGLSTARFVYDWARVGSIAGDSHYGTVTGIAGSNVYYDDGFGTRWLARTSVLSPWTAWENVFPEIDPTALRGPLRKKELYDLDVIPDDFFVGGEIVKFFPFIGSTLVEDDFASGNGLGSAGDSATVAPSWFPPMSGDAKVSYEVDVQFKVDDGTPGTLAFDLVTEVSAGAGWMEVARSSYGSVGFSDHLNPFNDQRSGATAVRETINIAAHQGINTVRISIENYLESLVNSVLVDMHGNNKVDDADSFAGLEYYSQYISGTSLYGKAAYSVRQGSIVSNIGTIELDRPVFPEDAQVGDHIYVRKPLVFSGNPADIVWRMLTGSNTDVRFDPTESAVNKDIHYETWLSSRAALVPLGGAEFWKLVDDEGTGAVLREIQAISRDCLANAFIDEEDRFLWQTYYPRTVPTGADIKHFHQATSVKDLRYTENIEDVFTKVIIDFGYNAQAEDARLVYGNRYEQEDLAAGSALYGLDRTQAWQSQWLHDRNFARQTSLRYLRRYGAGVNRIAFDSSLYGLIGTVTGFIGVTHETAARATNVYELIRTEKRLSDREVILEGLDSSDLYYGRGFAKWEENWAGGTGPATATDVLNTETVSGTSTGGWGTNLTDSSPIGVGGTCLGINTVPYGTVFKWW